jgi:hypothetical protein
MAEAHVRVLDRPLDIDPPLTLANELLADDGR